jgi:hypothetical protein
MVEDVVRVCMCCEVRVVVSVMVGLRRYLINRASRRASYRCLIPVFHGLVPV